jgi:glycosyltransferase involved in cell wall biosynthesis
VVGTIANFKAHKGYPYLLQAAVRVRERVPNVRFVVVGQGPLEDEVKREAAALGVSDTFVFTGFREDVPRLASIFDLFVLSSIHEGLSIALLEAMSLGIPAVVTSVGGLPEVVEDGQQGYLVPPRDPRALAARISELLVDEQTRSEMGGRAAQRAAGFDIRNSVRRAETIYGELLK